MDLTLELANATMTSLLTAIFSSILASLGLMVGSGRMVGLVGVPFTVPNGPGFICGSLTTTLCWSD